MPFHVYVPPDPVQPDELDELLLDGELDDELDGLELDDELGGELLLELDGDDELDELLGELELLELGVELELLEDELLESPSHGVASTVNVSGHATPVDGRITDE
ncbi:MAG: hypothetical protein JWP89_2684 [Schlesneria sp.]|nr:hypothetical protein [Schlesneria sp.]